MQPFQGWPVPAGMDPGVRCATPGCVLEPRCGSECGPQVTPRMLNTYLLAEQCHTSDVSGA